MHDVCPCDCICLSRDNPSLWHPLTIHSQRGPPLLCRRNCYSLSAQMAMAECASYSQTPPWIQLPSEIWALIGSHLGTRDFARASSAIKVLCGLQPLALNMAHILTEVNKTGELLWGLKRSYRVLSAVIGLKSSNDYFEICPMLLLQRGSFPCLHTRRAQSQSSPSFSGKGWHCVWYVFAGSDGSAAIA